MSGRSIVAAPANDEDQSLALACRAAGERGELDATAAHGGAVSVCSPVAQINLLPQQRLRTQDLLKAKIFVVSSGVVSIDTMVGKEQRQILDFLLPGDVLPTVDCALPKAYSLRAITNVALFDGGVASDGGMLSIEAWQSISAKTRRQLYRANLHLQTIGHLNTVDRVASFLLSYSLRTSHLTNDGTMDLPMSRNDIADYLAINRDTISRIMSRLETLGVIERISRNKVRVTDRSRLKGLTSLAATISEMHDEQQTS